MRTTPRDPAPLRRARAALPRSGRAAAALLVAVTAVLGVLAAATPAAAQDRVVTITREGVSPQVFEVRSGDRVVFVNEDRTFAYRARSTTANWEFDSGPLGLLPGRSYAVPEPVTAAGTYGYVVAEGEEFAGQVVVPGAAAAASPSPSPSPQPTSSGGTGPVTPPAPAAPGSSPTPAAGSSPAPSSSPATAGGPASPSPSPTSTGGAGVAGLPPLSGGFGVLPGSPAPVAEGQALPPELAPLLPSVPLESGSVPLPEAAPEVAAAPLPGVAALPLGSLPGTPSERRLGLAAVLAAVASVGVASLLVRVLLSEPVAAVGRRSAPRFQLAGPVATVD